MLPLRDPDGTTGHADDIDDFPTETEPAERPAVGLAARPAAAHRGRAGTGYDVAVRDTVTGAPELARATLNLAAAHTDPGASPYGRRLVYGGHTISIAGAHATRALPDLATIVAWRSCDHTGPVFEGDVLRTELTVDAVHAAGRPPAAGPAGGRARQSRRAGRRSAAPRRIRCWTGVSSRSRVE